MVENVEELRPELGGEPHLELKGLGHRGIHVVEATVAPHAAGRGTEASVGWRNQNGTAQRVAAQVGERSHGEWAVSRSLRHTGRIAGTCEIRNSGRSVGRQRNALVVASGRKVVGVAVE